MKPLNNIIAMCAWFGLMESSAQSFDSAKPNLGSMIEVEGFGLYTTTESANRVDSPELEDIPMFVKFYRQKAKESIFQVKLAPPNLINVFRKAKQLRKSGDPQPFLGSGRWFAFSQKSEHFLIFIDDEETTMRLAPANKVSKHVFLAKKMFETTQDPELFQYVKEVLRTK